MQFLPGKSLASEELLSGKFHNWPHLSEILALTLFFSLSCCLCTSKPTTANQLIDPPNNCCESVGICKHQRFMYCWWDFCFLPLLDVYELAFCVIVVERFACMLSWPELIHDDMISFRQNKSMTRTCLQLGQRIRKWHWPCHQLSVQAILLRGRSQSSFVNSKAWSMSVSHVWKAPA